MKLSARSEYACLALVELSERYGSGYVKTADISHSRNIPKKYLEQILLELKRSGYVRSRKGAEGGYKLAKTPGEISLADVVRLMDGALAPVESASKYFHEHTPIEQSAKLLGIFRDIRDYISDKMERTTFADLMS